MSKVTSIELKNDKNGNPMKVTTFDNGKKVFVNSKYDEPIYESVVDGSEFDLVEENGFNKIKYDKPAPPRSNYSKPAQIEKAMERKEAGIEKTLDRKEDSFRTSATFRDATVLTAETIKLESQRRPMNENDIKEIWLDWRKWLLENYETLPF